MGAVPEHMGAVPELMGAVPELMGAIYLATLVTNTQFVSTHYLTLMTVNGKACHNYCREAKIPKPMTSINISLPDSMRAYVDQFVKNKIPDFSKRMFEKRIKFATTQTKSTCVD